MLQRLASRFAIASLISVSLLGSVLTPSVKAESAKDKALIECLSAAETHRAEDIAAGVDPISVESVYKAEVKICYQTYRNALKMAGAIAQADSGTGSISCDGNGNCVEIKCDSEGHCTEKSLKLGATPAPGCFPNGPVISCQDEVATRIDDPCDSDKTPSPVGSLCDRESGQINPLNPTGKDFDPPVNDPPTSSEGVGGTRLI